MHRCKNPWSNCQNNFQSPRNGKSASTKILPDDRMTQFPITILRRVLECMWQTFEGKMTSMRNKSSNVGKNGYLSHALESVYICLHKYFAPHLCVYLQMCPEDLLYYLCQDDYVFAWVCVHLLPASHKRVWTDSDKTCREGHWNKDRLTKFW